MEIDIKLRGGRKFLLNGEETIMYPISAIAKALRDAGDPRSTQTIRIWERKGIIPEAKYRVNGYRKYTAPQVMAIVRAVLETEDMGRGVPIVDTDFSELAYEYFEEASN